MTVQEAINRGNNLVATAIVGISGLAFLPEVFNENDLEDRLDDGLLFIVGIAAIIWYFVGKNRFSHSIVPILFVVAGLIIKIAALIVEFDDPFSAGDDYGALILFVLTMALVIWLYVKSRTLVENR